MDLCTLFMSILLSILTDVSIEARFTGRIHPHPSDMATEHNYAFTIQSSILDLPTLYKTT
jgi:hypothetical protein